MHVSTVKVCLFYAFIAVSASTTSSSGYSSSCSLSCPQSNLVSNAAFCISRFRYKLPISSLVHFHTLLVGSVARVGEYWLSFAIGDTARCFGS